MFVLWKNAAAKKQIQLASSVQGCKKLLGKLHTSHSKFPVPRILNTWMYIFSCWFIVSAYCNLCKEKKKEKKLKYVCKMN